MLSLTKYLEDGVGRVGRLVAEQSGPGWRRADTLLKISGCSSQTLLGKLFYVYFDFENELFYHCGDQE